MDKPLLLIDVDGVLNPLNPGKETKGWKQHRLMGYNVFLNPLHGEWLNGLADFGFELVWGTTWEDDANRLIGPILGLPKLRVCKFPLASEGATWKMRGVKAFVKDRPFVWLDDDLHDDADAWVASRTKPSLLIKVDPRMGLLEHHIAKASAFYHALTSGKDLIG